MKWGRQALDGKIHPLTTMSCFSLHLFFGRLSLGSVARLNFIGQWHVNKAHLAVDAL